MRKGLLICALVIAVGAMAQVAVPVGAGSYASFVPLAESRSSQYGGCQAYQMEHRRIYAVDSLLTRALPSNDWWTYALLNQWTGKLWAYPALVWADETGISVAKPSYWEPTGCEMKWNTPLTITTTTASGDAFTEALLADWSDYMISFVMQTGTASVLTTVMHGSPLVWMEFENCTPIITNPDPNTFAVFEQTIGTKKVVCVAVLTDGLTASDIAPYAFRIPRKTRIDYAYTASSSLLRTTFHVDYEDLMPTSAEGVLQGFLPHHYYHTSFNFQLSTFNYITPRGQMRIATGNDWTFDYTVHPMLPFFPVPQESLVGYSAERLSALCADYAAGGSFGADTYWGGKGLTQMMHYMTAALQLGDTASFRLAKSRLKETLINWYTYTPGESQYYFARYNRWGALVGFDPSYDSDTFNDHHFHYGYFVYASAVLCLLDEDFRVQYGPMAKEVARDYANWQRDDNSEPWFRTLDPYCGHSFAGGTGNGGNGNGQESSSEAMQGWGGVWMLGAALNDAEMLEAGVFGYTLEARATAEYWFDRERRNIDYTKYMHPYCCNLTMQGVGWWTWFSGDPVWMHSIQWLPISPVLQNYLSEDLGFARWDYTQMYAGKEVGNYEAQQGGLGDESGLGNVCLSYLALFDPDSAAHVWDDMDKRGKALAKNTDTGGITYLLAHSLRDYGTPDHSILSDYALSAAYVDTLSGEVGTQDTTYAVFNATDATIEVRFWSGNTTLLRLTAPAHKLTMYRRGEVVASVETIADDSTAVPQDSIAKAWKHVYPNLALHRPVTASSSENAGTQPAGATDGSYTTRWGSEHRDNEYIVVDLQQRCYVDHVIIHWEAAYASRLELAISDDKNTWQSVECTSSGGTQTVPFASLLMASGGTARGRYLRLTGLSRATVYGTSLYELEAYGLPLASDPNELIVLEITSEQQSLSPDEKPIYTIRGYNASGVEMAVSPATTTTTTTTTTTLKAQCQSQSGKTITATYTWPILEVVVLDSTAVSPSEVTVAVGEPVVFTILALDQFGCSLSSNTQTFIPTSTGDTTLYFDGTTAVVHVVAFADYNLALGKPATASGAEGDGTKAEKAVDGKLDSRWSSRFQDNEWIQVDLKGVYVLSRIKLYWEAAYASSYEIQSSTDGISYTTIYANKSCKGGTETIDLTAIEDAAIQNALQQGARFVRIVCLKRNTGYGASLWEMEVYGSARLDPTELVEVQNAECTMTNILRVRDYISR